MPSYPQEIKAEILINHLTDCDPGKIASIIFFQGIFKRNYLEDILYAEQKINRENRIEHHFFLNRDGFYHKLPEGLFHKQDRFLNLTGSSSEKQFTREYEKQEKEIEDARLFFHPFENDLFSINLKIDRLLDKWIVKREEYLYQLFLKSSTTYTISEVYKRRIIPFFSSFSGIRGNIHKLTFFLRAVLQSNVMIRQKEGIATMQVTLESLSNVLNEAVLNTNFICGDEYSDLCIGWDIDVTVSNEVLSDYIEKTQMKSFFEFVRSYFVPAGVIMVYYLQVDPMIQFALHPKEQPGKTEKQYLGYNIFL